MSHVLHTLDIVMLDCQLLMKCSSSRLTSPLQKARILQGLLLLVINWTSNSQLSCSGCSMLVIVTHICGLHHLSMVRSHVQASCCKGSAWHKNSTSAKDLHCCWNQSSEIVSGATSVGLNQFRPCSPFTVPSWLGPASSSLA